MYGKVPGVSGKEEEEGEESDVEHVTKSIGVMKVDNNRAVFASEAHWYAILGEVCLSIALATTFFIVTQNRSPKSKTTSASTRSSMRSS